MSVMADAERRVSPLTPEAQVGVLATDVAGLHGYLVELSQSHGPTLPGGREFDVSMGNASMWQPGPNNGELRLDIVKLQEGWRVTQRETVVKYGGEQRLLSPATITTTYYWLGDAPVTRRRVQHGTYHADHRYITIKPAKNNGMDPTETPLESSSPLLAELRANIALLSGGRFGSLAAVVQSEQRPALADRGRTIMGTRWLAALLTRG